MASVTPKRIKAKIRSSVFSISPGLGYIFPSSVNNLPLDHPNGLCTTIPVINMSFDEIGEELRNWIDGKENEKLDKWIGKYGSEFIA